jgi:hypothetical protein
MKQDVNVTNNGMGSLAPDKGASMLTMKPGENLITNAAAMIFNDPLFKALTAELVLEPSEIKDWMRSDLDTDGAKLISPELIRAKRGIQAALAEADVEVAKFAINREWKAAKQNLQNLRSCGDSSEAFEEAQTVFGALDGESRRIGMPKYARTTKALRNYAASVLNYVEKLGEFERNKTAHEAVVDLETRLMPKVDNIYMGVPGKMEALARVQLKQPFDSVARLKELEIHLDGRSLHIDMDQEARVQGVANNAIFQTVFSRAGELPPDGAIFFLKAGQMVRVPNGSTPLMIDVSRLPLGLGKEGAGLFRFIGQEAEIDGAAVIKLKLKNGKPIPLKGSDPSNPKYAKEVAETIGVAPEWLRPGMTFGEVMKRCSDAAQQQRMAAAAQDEVKPSE